jgi:hypothetical protein
MSGFVDRHKFYEFVWCLLSRKKIHVLYFLGLAKYHAYNTQYPCRSSGSLILEALHSDPASSLSVEQERGAKTLKPPARFVIMITML